MEFAAVQGSVLARIGEVEGVIANFNHTKELDLTLMLNPAARANELAEWSETSNA